MHITFIYVILLQYACILFIKIIELKKKHLILQKIGYY